MLFYFRCRNFNSTRRKQWSIMVKKGWLKPQKCWKNTQEKKYAKHCFSYELAAEIVSKIQDNKQCALMVRYSLLFAQRDLKSVEQFAVHNGAKFLWFLYFCNNECFHDFFFIEPIWWVRKFGIRFSRNSSKQVLSNSYVVK